ncbi:1,4-dihydroxy-2-naphthoate octaprenyltransferase [Roseospira marina]|uniref:1,4-dihydroxy-2-naphthoate octaprenyltransferase n=1 Tax=Roseospira marina TaxID=140057 RepID=A0A5M6IEQ4_9PROT|nr:1,4-dihydroxy-2-naphthoate octaprenyltransferase [Roseospira marina]KAA5606195.1 1,4-dihydroxy-2-naphthoate octaprenyltransferase [Roseospira marina]MBB4314340.1 1,4-dihydroxy-2-naphthoate octaprenyltransferase [Roseospira marina]MBB5087500.1 1,4-dihydroxy-2-naphthoate octaprenyltransferase [Roseospira marina]
MNNARSPEPRPSWPVIAWHAIRPRTLPLSLSPVIAGAALGWAESGAARPGVTAAAALSALAIQVGTNLHNDAADTLNHTDGEDRVGPPRVTARGWMSPTQVLMAAHAAFALAVLLGVWLVWQGGWPILTIGVLSVLAGYAYSAGPWPISRGPWGELAVIAFFGVAAVGGVTYLHTGTVGPPAVGLGLIVGLLAAAVLLVNNTRDIGPDTRAGRRTLAIRLGPSRAVWVYGVLMMGALAGLLTLALVDPTLRGAALGLVTAPLAWRAWRAFATAGAPGDFNAVLARTGGVQAAMALTTAIGLVLL